jgi:hypothetical protein
VVDYNSGVVLTRIAGDQPEDGVSTRPPRSNIATKPPQFIDQENTMHIYTILDADDDTSIDQHKVTAAPWVVAPTAEAAWEAWMDYASRKLQPDVAPDFITKRVVPLTLTNEVIVAGQAHLEALAKLFQPRDAMKTPK